MRSRASAWPEALVARGVLGPTAQLAGELGVLAFKQGFDAWPEQSDETGDELAQHTLAPLEELAATASLG